MAATQGHTQSLHTNALDEALALPTAVLGAHRPQHPALPAARKAARRAIIDPWGGSYYVERLTARTRGEGAGAYRRGRGARRHGQGDRSGHAQARIEEAAARTQARIDSGQQIVIGVNTFRARRRARVDVLKVDTASVRARQIEKLKRLRAERDEAATQAALTALTEGARGKANLLALSRRGGARQGDRRRDFAGDGEGVRPPCRGDPLDPRRLPRGGGRRAPRRTSGCMAMTARLRGERGPPTAHPGRQDRPGRP